MLRIYALPLALAFSITGAAAQRPAATTAFTDVTVLNFDSAKPLANQTVIVEGDRITAVGPAGRVRPLKGSTVIEGKGKFLMPGFAEMHGHIPPPQAPPEFTERVLFLYVANGVTTVRGMLGAPGQLELREKARRGDILAPTLYLAGPSFNGQSVKTPEEAVQKVRQQKAEGWDLLKIHPGVPRDAYDAMARTAKEVGIPFAGHVPADVGILHALDMGQQTIDHLDGYVEHLGGDKAMIPEAKLVEAAERTKKAGAGVVPTMVLWEVIIGALDLQTVTNFPELRYMPKQTLEQWTAAHQKRLSNPKFDKAIAERVAQNRKRLLKVMNDRGVTILFGTDSPQQFSVPGFSIHREARSMADGGMSALEILRSGTRTVGEYFKSKDKFGQIATGQRADLILLVANPLEDIGNLSRRAGVMVRGRWLSEDEIQKRLSEIERR